MSSLGALLLTPEHRPQKYIFLDVLGAKSPCGGVFSFVSLGPGGHFVIGGVRVLVSKSESELLLSELSPQSLSFVRIFGIRLIYFCILNTILPCPNHSKLF